MSYKYGAEIEKRHLSFLAGVKVGEDIFFSGWDVNGLFKMDPNTGKCIYLKKFIGEGWQGIHSAAVHHEGVLWFIPYKSNRIAKVDLITLNITYIPLPEQGCEFLMPNGNRPMKFNCCYKEGERYFWLTPRAYNLLIRVDMITNELTICGEWPERQRPFSDSRRIGDEIWMCPYESREVYVFNIASGEGRRYSFGEKAMEYVNIYPYKEWMICFPRHLDNPIVMIDRLTGERKYLHCDVRKGQDYQVACINGKSALLVPYIGEEFIFIDFEKEKGSVIGQLQAEKMYSKNGNYLGCMRYGEDWIFIPITSGNPLLWYQTETQNITYFDIWIDRTQYDRVLLKSKNEIADWIVEQKRVILEEEISLKALCRALPESNKGERVYSNNIIGECIYQKLKEGKA